MVFNSLAFLIFFPVVLLLYRVLPKKAVMPMLLVASYVFYLSWQPDLVYLILGTTAVSYFSARGMEKTKSPGMRKLFLLAALIISLGVLFFFKYFNFLATNVAALLEALGVSVGDPRLSLILPVGISFYTFQTLSYCIDVYRGKIAAERNFLWYALYVSFFPQLVAGPIERPENLLPALKTYHPFDASDTLAGFRMMAVGFFKKIVVADRLAALADGVFNHVGADAVRYNGFTVALAAVAFAIQIYCDFSGYTDIAIGCARVMGIRLMQNFDRPYSATDIRGFWRRWHISLTSWFTDYLYIPLGGSKKGTFRRYLNILIVFLASGIWHGAAWTFLLWGLLHGVYQIVGHLTKPVRAKLLAKLRVSDESVPLLWVRRAVTFALVTFAWIFFRANSLSDLASLIKTLFTGWGGVSVSASLRTLGVTPTWGAVAVLSVGLLSFFDRKVTAFGGACAGRFTARSAAVWLTALWSVLVAWAILLAAGGDSAFIYFQF